MITGHIVTYMGKVIEPLNPDPDAICIEDIAHALANLCRFTGHTREMYSVAQHSLLVSLYVSTEHALAGLLHDASEAYLSDVSRPIKMQPEFGDTYKKYERRLEAVIAIKYGLEWPWHPSIKHADDVLLRTEQRDLMPPLLHIDGDDFLPWTIRPWLPARAEQEFLYRFNELVG